MHLFPRGAQPWQDSNITAQAVESFRQAQETASWLSITGGQCQVYTIQQGGHHLSKLLFAEHVGRTHDRLDCGSTSHRSHHHCHHHAHRYREIPKVGLMEIVSSSGEFDVPCQESCRTLAASSSVNPLLHG